MPGEFLYGLKTAGLMYPTELYIRADYLFQGSDLSTQSEIEQTI